MRLRGIEKIVKGEEEEELEGYHIFSNGNRREVYRELTRRPCVTSSQISQSAGINVRNVIWHLGKLKREGFVGELRGRRHLYYPLHLVMESDLSLFSILNSKQGRKIVRSLYFGCKSIQELEENISHTTLYRILKKLKDMEMINIHRGRRSLVCLEEEFFRKVEDYDKLGLEFKKKFMEKIETRGYTVELIGTYDYEVKLRISGREKFTMGIFISPIRTSLGVS